VVTVSQWESLLSGSAESDARGAGMPAPGDLAALETVADLAIQATIANSNYQAALQTTANIRQASLLDFLH
jgi:hypothetical protein